MFKAAKYGKPREVASAFVFNHPRNRPCHDVWAEFGHSTELAHSNPVPIGIAARLVIVLALATTAKLLSMAAVLWL